MSDILEEEFELVEREPNAEGLVHVNHDDDTDSLGVVSLDDSSGSEEGCCTPSAAASALIAALEDAGTFNSLQVGLLRRQRQSPRCSAMVTAALPPPDGHLARHRHYSLMPCDNPVFRCKILSRRPSRASTALLLQRYLNTQVQSKISSRMQLPRHTLRPGSSVQPHQQLEASAALPRTSMQQLKWRQRLHPLRGVLEEGQPSPPAQQLLEPGLLSSCCWVHALRLSQPSCC